jgi:quercetin dioxygenase-like cupin family protein
MVRRSVDRAGRVVPAEARFLKARVVRLARGGAMPRHSTQRREELLVALEGAVEVDVEVRAPAGRGRSAPAIRRVPLAAGQTLFLPSATPHGVRNVGAGTARYLYVTAGLAPRPRGTGR